MKDAAPSAIYLKDYTPPHYWIETVDLVFELGEVHSLVTSTLKCVRNSAFRTGQPLVLQGEQLELVSVKLDGETLDKSAYVVTDKGLTIADAPERFKLEIVTRIQPQNNTSLEGLYQSSGNFCTQCEAEGFRKITYYADRPDVMALFSTTIIADRDKYPVLLSNGNPVEQGEYDDGRHWVKWVDPFRKPCYLFALVAGDLDYIEDHYTTMSGREVRCRIYVQSHNIDKCDHAMASLKKSMQWDEQTWGREYDLDVYNIVAVDDFNMGAMENKGLNIFNSKYVLAKQDTATDTDFINIEGVIGHEYFHNWSGNRVTCRDWFQLTLKEGLTVFRDQQFTADMNAATPKRIDDVNILRTAQFAEDSGPMAHPIQPASYVEINNFYTVTVYNKGAEVIRMIHTLLGAEGFRRGMDLYFERHDGQAVTTDDFVAAMEDANDISLALFKRWYKQAGTPTITVSESYDAASKQYQLTVQQHTPPTPGQDVKLPFHIPLRCGLLGEQGDDLEVTCNGVSAREHVLELKQDEQTFVFDSVEQKPVLSILRNFSAPVKVAFERSDEELAFLMAHDSDEFNRWDAGQNLASRLILSLVEAQQNNQPMGVPDYFVEAVDKVTQDASLDKALAARMITLPSWSYIAEQMETIAVDEIHQAREFIYTHLAAQLAGRWRSLYEDNRNDQYDLSPQQMGQRFLKNQAMAYLLRNPDEDNADTVLQQFEQADNMTDQQAAFTQLVHQQSRYAERAIDSFYQQWKADQLVLDKWFMIQATTPVAETLSQVEALLQHQDFSLSNPNRVRACLGAFCSANPVAFHGNDGAGYQLLAKYVEILDKLNPQVAARMTIPLTRWRRYDPARQQHMQTVLQQLRDIDGLSADVYELVDKSLSA